MPGMDYVGHSTLVIPPGCTGPTSSWDRAVHVANMRPAESDHRTPAAQDTAAADGWKSGIYVVAAAAAPLLS